VRETLAGAISVARALGRVLGVLLSVETNVGSALAVALAGGMAVSVALSETERGDVLGETGTAGVADALVEAVKDGVGFIVMVVDDVGRPVAVLVLDATADLVGVDVAVLEAVVLALGIRVEVGLALIAGNDDALGVEDLTEV